MPHVAYKCPDPAMWSLDDTGGLNQTVSIPDCLNCSLTRNDRGCHYDYADLAARDENQYAELFSPSRFNGCDRELYLRDKHDYWTDPAEQTYRVRGTASHTALEVQHEGIICETRVYRELPGAVDHEGKPAVISVKPDKVYPKLGVIHDDKTYKYLPRGGEGYKPGEVHPIEIKDSYRLQLSIGAWAWAAPMMRDGVAAPAPITITSGQITFRDGSTQLRIRDIALFPFSNLESYMRGRVAELNAVRLGQEPGYCAEDSRWKCATCPVRYLCGIPKELYVKPKKETKRAQPTRSANRRHAN